MSDVRRPNVDIELPTIGIERPGYVELVLSLVLVWGFGDTVSTLVATALTGGVAAEANPWIRTLLAHDPLLVVALKGAVVLYVGVVLVECRPLVERVPGWRLWLSLLVGFGALVTLGNVAVGFLAVV